MVTDLVSHLTLTQQDEGAALRLLQEQETLVRPTLGGYSGREIKTIGDAFLPPVTPL